MNKGKAKPIENIKKICKDLGGLFEELESQSQQIEESSKKEVKNVIKDKKETFSKLKQQLADLS